MTRENRVVVKMDDRELQMLDELAARDHMSRGMYLRQALLSAHRTTFPPRKLGAVEARQLANAAKRVVFHGGQERTRTLPDGRRMIYHAAMDGTLGWGPRRFHMPNREARGAPITGAEFAAWEASRGEPPHDARDILTKIVEYVHEATGKRRDELVAADPADQEEYERRLQETGNWVEPEL